MAGADAEKCPVDHSTRELWLEAARARGSQDPRQLYSNHFRPASASRFSLDTGRWEPSLSSSSSQRKEAKLGTSAHKGLSTDRDVSSIPRALSNNHDTNLNSAERVALPSNSEIDTGHDRDTGNWIYPSQDMFFKAMKRKGHAAEAADMATVVPIHNAVNEKAWAEIKAWESGQGSEACGGPKLVSFAGDSKALTPRARWRNLIGYQKPFDRHDWVVDRCGKHIDYVIDFYTGKDEGKGPQSLNFYLDVRPKLNSWEGVKTRAMKSLGMG